tara:strand:+ start:385 stop:681 length:297 start_codon:yes stop_codon:yes gene_type:complete
MDLLVATSKLKVVVVAEQDSPKVKVEMLVLVVDLVTSITRVCQGQNYLRHPLILLKVMQVEQQIIPTPVAAVVVVPVVLEMLVGQVIQVMVDQELLLP